CGPIENNARDAVDISAAELGKAHSARLGRLLHRRQRTSMRNAPQSIPPRVSRSTVHTCTGPALSGTVQVLSVEYATGSDSAIPVRSFSKLPAEANHETRNPSRLSTSVRVAGS